MRDEDKHRLTTILSRILGKYRQHEGSALPYGSTPDVEEIVMGFSDLYEYLYDPEEFFSTHNYPSESEFLKELLVRIGIIKDW